MSTHPLSAADAPRASSPSASADSRDRTDSDATGLKLLERCARQLAATQTRLAASRSPDSQSGTDAEVRAACLRRPDVLDVCRQHFAPQGADTDDPPSPSGSASSAASTAGPDFARRFATGVVGTTDAEAEWVEDYLCSVHRLRETMVEDLDDLLERGADAAEIDEVIDRARDDRTAVLEDLENRLGADRYARLRAVGGLGVMGSALDCSPT